MRRVPLDKEGWRILVRRALGVPDVVSDRVAIEIATDLIYTSPSAANEVRGRNVEFEEAVGGAIVEAVVDAGEAGQLDRFIVGRPSSTNDVHGAPGVGALDEQLMATARATTGLAQLPPGLAGPLLVQIKSFLSSHPLYPNGWAQG